MNLKSKVIKEIISSSLKEKFSNEGFSYRKTMNEFIRVEANFIYTFNIELLSWSNAFSIYVNLFISQKEIEKNLQKIIGKQQHKITLGQELSRIFKSPDGREVINGDLSIWLKEDKDVEAAIESLEWYYNDIAKKYFNRFQTLEDIDDIINNPPFDYCPAYVGGFFDARCMKGLIVAKLVSNPEYHRLEEIYNKRLLEINNLESIENYTKVRNYLKENKLSKL